jgi:hypothetical protein
MRNEKTTNIRDDATAGCIGQIKQRYLELRLDSLRLCQLDARTPTCRSRPLCQPTRCTLSNRRQCSQIRTRLLERRSVRGNRFGIRGSGEGGSRAIGSC